MRVFAIARRATAHLFYAQTRKLAKKRHAVPRLTLELEAMTDSNSNHELPPRRDALPSKRARFLAFAGIVVAGVCGALAGYAFGDLQGSSSVLSALWALAGGVGAAIGVAIVATLILRAMDEWEQQS